MRILVLDTYYQEPLRLIYESHSGLEHQTYADQSRAVYDFGFARADFLPLNLRKLNHIAEQFIINCPWLQRSWAREHGLQLSEKSLLSTAAKVLGKSYAGLKRVVGAAPNPRLQGWELKVLNAQVEAFQPDVILICDV